MISRAQQKRLVTSTLMTLTVLLTAGNAHAEAPVKLIVESQYGANVNASTGENVCTVSSGDTCQPGIVSALPGGFGEFAPEHVAVAPNGNIYAADTLNNRVQELTPAGKFVLMFGKEVNETTHGNICTQQEIEAEGVKCEAGKRATVAEPEPGALAFIVDVAVDPASGGVYVAESFSEEGSIGSRVQEFTAGGQFVLEIGKEVNETAHTKGEADNENRCPVNPGDTCRGPAQRQAGTPYEWGTVHGSFNFGDLSGRLAVGGPEDRLYVGDEHRVQEFKADGSWVHDLLLTSISSQESQRVEQIAVDQASGDVYVIYGRHQTFSGHLVNEPGPVFDNVIREFDATDKQIGEFTLHPIDPFLGFQLEGMALDSSGRLAVIEDEEGARPPGGGFLGPDRRGGMLLNASTGKPITQFTVLPLGTSSYQLPADGLAFSAGDVHTGEMMYGASYVRNELVGYVPKEVAELLTGAVTCTEEAEHETSQAFECELTGQVNPEGVAKTETLFRWGRDQALSGPETRETARQPVATGGTLVPAPTAVIKGLRPNEPVYSELAGYDEFNEPPERALTGEAVSGGTPLVAPKIVSVPSVSFVKAFSAVMFGELNPENANTEFFFEYGPGEALQECPLGVRQEACPGVARTAIAESSAYGRVATTLEATGLQPATVYRYRLSAESEGSAKAKARSTPKPEDEGVFTTAPAPAPRAQTGPASAIGATTATISGAVNPDGQQAVYGFELGVYDGALTQYGVVFTGPAGAGTVAVAETLGLTGLQPGTTYAYRITIKAAGTGQSVEGEAATFTTAGLPSVLSVPTPLAMLAVPNVAFPAQAITPGTSKPKARCKPHHKRDRHGRCVKFKRKAKRHGKGASRKAK